MLAEVSASWPLTGVFGSRSLRKNSVSPSRTEQDHQSLTVLGRWPKVRVITGCDLARVIYNVCLTYRVII